MKLVWPVQSFIKLNVIERRYGAQQEKIYPNLLSVFDFMTNTFGYD
jgi:hypothetical protein